MSLPPELLEKIRQTGIRIDSRGRLWHDGAEITHEGFRKAILRWLDVLDDGRPIIRLDNHRYAYVDVDDAPLLVVSARLDGDAINIVLNDGTEERLDPTSLSVATNNALYCRVRQGRLTARITTIAYQEIARHLVEQDGGFALVLGGQVFSIGHKD